MPEQENTKPEGGPFDFYILKVLFMREEHLAYAKRRAQKHFALRFHISKNCAWCKGTSHMLGSTQLKAIEFFENRTRLDSLELVLQVVDQT